MKAHRSEQNSTPHQSRSDLECPPSAVLRRGDKSPAQSCVKPQHSKTRRWLGAVCILHAVLCLSAFAQYAIDWHTIDGGGGTSTGGVYSISGTIGQPDANAKPMTNGQYSVTGGFWAINAIQTPGAPLLSIAPAGPGQATVSWNPDTPGYVLQETGSLSPTNWINSASGSTNPTVVPAAGPTKFYRLHKP